MAPSCEIEYDVEKRNKTLANRGLDFDEAPHIFARRTLSKVDDRKDYGEERIITAGKLDDRYVMLVWTWRGKKRRIISMRYANEREIRQISGALD